MALTTVPVLATEVVARHLLIRLYVVQFKHLARCGWRYRLAVSWRPQPTKPTSSSIH